MTMTTTPNNADDLVDGRRARPIFAEPTPDGRHLRFWCPWCDKWHAHGRPTPGTDETPYRESHCIADNSPLRGAIYRLVEVPKVARPRRRYPVRYGRDGRIYTTFGGR